MAWFQQMLNPCGRAGRSAFWRAMIGLCLAVVALAFATLGVAVGLGVTITIKTALFAVHVKDHDASFSAPVLLLVILPVAVRRLHDRDKGAWWLIPFYLVPIWCSWLAEAVGYGADTAVAALPASFESALEIASAVLEAIVLLVGLVLSIWSFIELGLLRGTLGRNRFGPDPRVLLS